MYDGTPASSKTPGGISCRAAITRPISTARSLPAVELVAVQRFALDVRVDDGPAALGQRDEAGRLRHRDRQALAQLGQDPGLGLEGEGGRGPSRSPDHPAHAAVVVDERDVVLAAGVVGR